MIGMPDEEAVKLVEQLPGQLEQVEEILGMKFDPASVVLGMLLAAIVNHPSEPPIGAILAAYREHFAYLLDAVSSTKEPES